MRQRKSSKKNWFAEIDEGSEEPILALLLLLLPNLRYLYLGSIHRLSLCVESVLRFFVAGQQPLSLTRLTSVELNCHDQPSETIFFRHVRLFAALESVAEIEIRNLDIAPQLPSIIRKLDLRPLYVTRLTFYYCYVNPTGSVWSHLPVCIDVQIRGAYIHHPLEPKWSLNARVTIFMSASRHTKMVMA